MRIDWKIVLNVLLTTFTIIIISGLLVEIYIFGYKQGEISSTDYYEGIISSLAKDQVSSYIPSPVPQGTQSPKTTTPTAVAAVREVNWGGPELWELVNKVRVEHGVGQLKQVDELCTIASIRLNELLALGALDGHSGFSNLSERRTDLKWIFEKYVVAEFLIQGPSTAQEAVDLWLNTMGHKKLITGGEYVYGCIYAQNSFAVAIAAY
jgi:uncharacterized protein YkwD